MQGGLRAIFIHGRNFRRDYYGPLGLVSPVGWPRHESSKPEPLLSTENSKLNGVEDDDMSITEAKKLMQLGNMEELKKKLGVEEKEVIPYIELLKACENTGIAKSRNEAASFARKLDEAGVVLLFRDNVYLHPDKVVDMVRRSVPLVLTSEDDPRKDELKKLQDEKERLDILAHKQVRRILWSGLGIGVMQIGLFFRLTFWEFSWDVMEPVAFFAPACLLATHTFSSLQEIQVTRI